MWLRMDRPTNLMVIDTLLFLDGAVDLDRLAAVVRARLVGRYPVFAERPVPGPLPGGRPRWVRDPDLDVDRHLVRATLPGDDDAALQRYVEACASAPLDRDRPLWQMHVLDGYRGGSVVLSRCHHALADGVALTQVLLSLTDDSPGGTPDLPPLPPIPRPAEHRGPPLAALDPVARLARRITDPRLAGNAARLARDGLSTARGVLSTADKLLLGPPPPAPFRGVVGTAKRAVWGEPLPLEHVKRVCALTGATVNDVLMAAAAGALATYAEARGAEVREVSTMVPVNLRPPGRPLPRELGNQFALVLFRYPTTVRDPLARLAETRRRMDAIKQSPEAVLTFALMTGIGLTARPVERVLVGFFAGKALGVTTNVPGPRTVRYLAGSPVTGILAWVPGSGTQTVGISICTYAGTVRVGFMVDAAGVPEPELLVGAFENEVTSLLRVTHTLSG
jgi:WS/DGAT/MGAT family acyltransferase